jgi:hypothetical protein
LTKFRPTQEQIDVLQRYINDPKREIHSARYRLDEFADLVEKGKLPETFLSFEVLDQITRAQEKGFSRDECLGVVPECLASETVEVPIYVLNTLLDCYDHFIHSDPTKASLEKSFGFAAPKPKSNPIQQVIEKLDNDRYLAQQVLIRRIEAWSEGRKLKLVQAFVNVAAEENVGPETVRRAWHSHRSYYKKLLREMKLPTKKIG